MSGMIAALVTSIVCVFIHFLIIATGAVKINPDWSIKKLKRHAELLLFIWIMLVPLFIYVYRAFDIRIVSGDICFNYVYGIIIFAALFFVYLTFYYVVDRSVSTRIMLEIESSPEKRLTLDEVKSVYDLDTKYRNELKGMHEGGFVKKDGEYYSNTLKGTIVARGTALYKKIFRLGKGG